MSRDLFGEPVPPTRHKADEWLAEIDKLTLAERAARLRRVMEIYPDDSQFLMPMESAVVFGEARSTYVNGEYAAVLMLAQAFVEHRLQSYLQFRGDGKIARAGLAAILRHLGKQQLLNDHLLGRLEHLKDIRNPFTHLRPSSDPHGLGRRTIEKRMDPEQLMEREAHAALSLMLTVAVARLPGER